MGLDATIIASTSTPLALGGVFREAMFVAGIKTQRRSYEGRAMIRGSWNSNVNGTLDIYQCLNETDAGAITNGAPAAGTGDAINNLTTFAFVSTGVACKGQPFFVPIVLPYIVVRYTNGGVIQATFRLQVEVVE